MCDHYGEGGTCATIMGREVRVRPLQGGRYVCDHYGEGGTCVTITGGGREVGV